MPEAIPVLDTAAMPTLQRDQLALLGCGGEGQRVAVQYGHITLAMDDDDGMSIVAHCRQVVKGIEGGKAGQQTVARNRTDTGEGGKEDQPIRGTFGGEDA